MESKQHSGRWNPADIVVLESGYFAGKDAEAIAAELERTTASVQSQIYRRGLACEKKRRHTLPKVQLRPAKTDCMPNPFEFMRKKRF